MTGRQLKMNLILFLSLFGSVQLAYLFSYTHPYAEITFLVIIASVSLAYSCIPSIATDPISNKFISKMLCCLILYSVSGALLIV
ncbi:MAG: hypothetical protein ACI4XL_07330 [Bacillus sp. (in: firmicutes)]